MLATRATTMATAIVMFAVGALLTLRVTERYGGFDPRPYWVTEFEWERVGDGNLTVHSEFYKFDGCVFDRLVARGYFLGVVDPHPIRMRDMNGDQGDREEGLHSADFLIGPLRQDYEAIEIRTRHICDGQYVGEVFGRIDLK